MEGGRRFIITLRVGKRTASGIEYTNFALSAATEKAAAQTSDSR